MTYPFGQNNLTLQTLDWGSIHQERLSPPDTMFCITGRQIYVIGDIDGRFRPRSNPYDLHSLGHPDPNDPLAGRLQGVWAQPVRGLAGYGYEITCDGECWPLEDAARFTQSYAAVQFEYHRAPLFAVRRDFASQDQPLLFSTLSLSNQGSRPLDLQVAFTVQFDLRDAWFTSRAPRPSQGEEVTIESGRLVARARGMRKRWTAIAAGAAAPAAVHLLPGSAGALVYHLSLAPGEESALTFAMAVNSQNGARGTHRIIDQALRDPAACLADNQAQYAALLSSGPRLHTPDPSLNDAFDLARANLRMLEAHSPALGRYFYAGLENFPFWFSNDGAYSTVGWLAAGLREPALNHIRIGSRHMPEGRVPHQISPSGRVAFAGNAQETPLWVLSVWEAYRWTADQAFLAEMYPAALRGMFTYVLGAIDSDGDGYPSGPGMVEMSGMGAEKLDSAAYTYAALNALAGMAEVLGDADSAARARQRVEDIASRFNADWWDERGGTYAMSLEDPGNTLHPVPHWAVIVPLEVGLSTPEHAARTFATLRAHYLNRWGLKHTVGSDERVWTLPTALLSRAAYHYAEPELGFEMLRHLHETLAAGSIGLFHELIPEGACIIQLWSAAAFIRGIIEDLLGITVDAARHHLSIIPHLPDAWDSAVLEDLTFGEHRITVRIDMGQITVEHTAGTVPLSIHAAGQSFLLKPAEKRIL